MTELPKWITAPIRLKSFEIPSTCLYLLAEDLATDAAERANELTIRADERRIWADLMELAARHLAAHDGTKYYDDGFLQFVRKANVGVLMAWAEKLRSEPND